MSRPYFTLCLWNTDNAEWEDEYGSYSKREATDEMQYHDKPRKHMTIVQTDGTLADLIAKRNALPAPATKAKKG